MSFLNHHHQHVEPCLSHSPRDINCHSSDHSPLINWYPCLNLAAKHVLKVSLKLQADYHGVDHMVCTRPRLLFCFL